MIHTRIPISVLQCLAFELGMEAPLFFSALHPQIVFGPFGNHAASGPSLHSTSQIPGSGILAPNKPPIKPHGSRYYVGLHDETYVFFFFFGGGGG